MKSYYFEFHTIPLVDELVEKGREREKEREIRSLSFQRWDREREIEEF